MHRGYKIMAIALVGCFAAMSAITACKARVSLPPSDDVNSMISPSSPSASPSASPPASPSASPPLIKMRKIHLTGTHRGYTVDVCYPQFRGGADAVMRRLNQEVKLVVDGNIAAVSGTAGNNFKYICRFTKVLVTPRLVSLNFEFDSYVGGAHNGKVEVPLNAQIYPEFKILSLGDVLGRKVNYRKLSNLCQNQQLFQGSISFRPMYFSNFTVSDEGMTIRLPQGKFTASALECPAITINYRKLNQNRLIGKNAPIQNLVAKSIYGAKKKSRTALARKRR